MVDGAASLMMASWNRRLVSLGLPPAVTTPSSLRLVRTLFVDPKRRILNQSAVMNSSAPTVKEKIMFSLRLAAGLL